MKSVSFFILGLVLAIGKPSLGYDHDSEIQVDKAYRKGSRPWTESKRKTKSEWSGHEFDDVSIDKRKYSSFTDDAVETTSPKPSAGPRFAEMPRPRDLPRAAATAAPTPSPIPPSDAPIPTPSPTPVAGPICTPGMFYRARQEKLGQFIQQNRDYLTGRSESSPSGLSIHQIMDEISHCVGAEISGHYSLVPISSPVMTLIHPSTGPDGTLVLVPLANRTANKVYLISVWGNFRAIDPKSSNGLGQNMDRITIYPDSATGQIKTYATSRQQPPAERVTAFHGMTEQMLHGHDLSVIERNAPALGNNLIYSTID